MKWTRCWTCLSLRRVSWLSFALTRGEDVQRLQQRDGLAGQQLGQLLLKTRAGIWEAEAGFLGMGR